MGEVMGSWLCECWTVLIRVHPDRDKGGRVDLVKAFNEDIIVFGRGLG